MGNEDSYSQPQIIVVVVVILRIAEEFQIDTQWQGNYATTMLLDPSGDCMDWDLFLPRDLIRCEQDEEK